MKRVTGIGGVFFKTEQPKDLKEWYQKHLGLPTTPDNYIVFEWKDAELPDAWGHTVWSPFKADTQYFEPSKKAFMVNYRVDDLEALLNTLRAEGVEVVGEMESYEYGKFGWILDPEGNKIELWEPADEEFRKVNKMS